MSELTDLTERVARLADMVEGLAQRSLVMEAIFEAGAESARPQARPPSLRPGRENRAGLRLVR